MYNNEQQLFHNLSCHTLNHDLHHKNKDGQRQKEDNIGEDPRAVAVVGYVHLAG